MYESDHSILGCHISSISYRPFSANLSLAIRDLSNLVKPEDIINSEHLTTLLAIVPKYSQKDWLSSYETLTSYVVRLGDKFKLLPLLPRDSEYCPLIVTCLNCPTMV